MKAKLLFALFVLACLAGIQQATAQGTAFTYQGKLNTNGSPATGSFDFEFKLFPDLLGSQPQVGATFTTNGIPVAAGLFTTAMDFGPGIFTGSNYFILIGVRTNGGSTYTTLSPLQRLAPTPYAIMANSASNLLGNLPATQLAGPVLSANLSGAYGNVVTLNNANDTFTGAFSGNGSGLTNVWQTGGNTGANPAKGAFLGTTDNNPLELRVDGSRALRLEPGVAGDGAPNVIGGSSVNFVSSGVKGATIGGGGAVNDDGAATNSVTGDYGTVAGGAQNTAGNFSMVGGGIQNSASNVVAVVVGGFDNTNTGYGSSIGGGQGNLIANSYATVSGGIGNTNTGFGSAIGGGQGNLVTSNYATISGGLSNVNTGFGSAIGGGQGNLTTNNYATIGGGFMNLTGAFGATVAGGQGNTNNGGYATVGGGLVNLTGAFGATVAGGQGNTNNGGYATVGGGFVNTATGLAATVGGGVLNQATTNYATVPGGSNNVASGVSSLAAGANAQAVHNGAFVWADSEGVPFASTNTNSFNVRANGGVRFVTGGAGLTVDGSINGSFNVGQSNISVGVDSSIGGGELNTNDGDFSFIGGGELNINQVSAQKGVIVGGLNNTNGSVEAFIGGGHQNLIAGAAAESVISGGEQNIIGVDADHSVISGGQQNNANGEYSFIGGGGLNVIADQALVTVITGGAGNTNDANYSFIGGGAQNIIQSNTVAAVISGGLGNSINPPFANLGEVIGGGGDNTNRGNFATIGGGIFNIATTNYAIVPGGSNNVASGVGSFAAGVNAHATNDGAFVWADSQAGVFSSTNNDSFNVRARGGMHFVTSGAGLSVDGPLSGNGGGLTNLNASQLTAGGAISVSNLSVSATNEIAPLSVTPRIPTSALGSVATASGANSVVVAGNFAYVTGNASASSGSLEIFDISNPALPSLTSSITTSSGLVSLAVAGRYVYTADQSAQNGVQSFDVSSPSDIISIGFENSPVPTVSRFQSVALQGRYLYVADSGLNMLGVYDVANPAFPQLTDFVSVGPGSPSPFFVAVAGRYAYVANSISNNLAIFDVGIPSAVTLVGTVATGRSPEGVAVAGRYAYVVNALDGNLDIFDIRNPASAILAGSITAGSEPFSVAIAGRYAYVANKGSPNLQIFDVSNPASPQSLGSVATAGEVNSVAVAGRYAYAVSGGNTLQVFDLGGAYIQQIEAGATETGTLQTRDTATIGDDLDVHGGLTVSASARISGGLSVDNGSISGSNFIGNGANLIGLNAQALTGSLPAISGASLLSLTPANLTGSGTLPAAALPASVALLNSNQTFTATNIFNKPVGIATTTTPQALLEIQGGADNSGANDQHDIALAYRTGGFRHWIRTRHNTLPVDNAIDFFVNTNSLSTGSTAPGTGNVLAMSINGGNVGIATAEPQATLDVNGSLRVNSGTTFTNFQAGQTAMSGGSATFTNSLSISFPKAFITTPKVIATANGQAGTAFGDTFVVSVRSATTTGCVVNIVRVDANTGWSQTISINWMAWE